MSVYKFKEKKTYLEVRLQSRLFLLKKFGQSCPTLPVPELLAVPCQPGILRRPQPFSSEEEHGLGKAPTQHKLMLCIVLECLVQHFVSQLRKFKN